MDNDTPFRRLLGFIDSELSFDCRHYNEAYIKRRLASRIICHRLAPDDFSGYMKVLEQDPGERRKLYEALTVNVTQFFRDVKLWETLKYDVFPRLIEEKRSRGGRNIMVWSCGCASGEEPYSLAIMLRELTAGRGITPKIIATDVSDESLARAREGAYGAAALESTPPEYVRRYFSKATVKGKERYVVGGEAKGLVKFLYHNCITQPPPASALDMIFCRNVIIYFTQAAKNALIDMFHSSLVPDGWLVMGKSEVIFAGQTRNRFSVYNAVESVYRKGQGVR